MRAALITAVFILTATIAHAQSPALERSADLANGVALVAHAADYASTVRCTTAGTCREGNRWVAPFVHGDRPDQARYFAAKWGTALASYYVKTRLKKAHPVWTIVAAGAESAAFFYIAKRNGDIHERATR